MPNPLNPANFAACISSSLSTPCKEISKAVEGLDLVALCWLFGAPPTFALCIGHLAALFIINGTLIISLVFCNLSIAASCINIFPQPHLQANYDHIKDVLANFIRLVTVVLSKAM